MPTLVWHKLGGNTQMDCIFCKIIAKELPSKILYEDELCLAIADINPQAPFHALIMPKTHVIEKAADIKAEHAALIGHIFTVATQITAGHAGYRVITNSGRAAGQSVDHLHFHVLAGRTFDERIV